MTIFNSYVKLPEGNLDMRRSGSRFPESVSLVDKDERLSGEGSGALSRVDI